MALPLTPEVNALTEKIIGCAMRVHSGLGPGLLESVYKAAMAAELSEAKLQFEIEVPLPVQYRDRHLPCGFRMDIVVENSVVLEIKSVAKLANIHRAQGITYVRLSGCKAGLILNFNDTRMRDGIMRIFNATPGDRVSAQDPDAAHSG